MTIREIVKQGFYYARTCRSLWLFGFFAGLGGGGSSGGGGGNDGAGGAGAATATAAASGFFGLSPIVITMIVVGVIFIVIAAILMHFISEGALIEGIVRVRQGGTMTTRDGFRAGWPHWGVLIRIGLLYVAATLCSLALLAAPSVIALRMSVPVAAILLAIPALVIAVPWLVTLYLVQAFATRIAVLENRRALDAIAKARLFLHGRLGHGLKLIVATLIGTVAGVLMAIVTMLPVALLLFALVPVLGVFPAIVIGCLVLVPVIVVLTTAIGMFRSSIWTIGYVTQVEA